MFNVFARADENPFSVISLIKLIYASEKATIPDQRRDLESLRTIIMYKMASRKGKSWSHGGSVIKYR